MVAGFTDGRGKLRQYHRTTSSPYRTSYGALWIPILSTRAHPRSRAGSQSQENQEAQACDYWQTRVLYAAQEIHGRDFETWPSSSSTFIKLEGVSPGDRSHRYQVYRYTIAHYRGLQKRRAGDRGPEPCSFPVITATILVLDKTLARVIVMQGEPCLIERPAELTEPSMQLIPCVPAKDGQGCPVRFSSLTLGGQAIWTCDPATVVSSPEYVPAARAGEYTAFQPILV